MTLPRKYPNQQYVPKYLIFMSHSSTNLITNKTDKVLLKLKLFHYITPINHTHQHIQITFTYTRPPRRRKILL